MQNRRDNFRRNYASMDGFVKPPKTHTQTSKVGTPLPSPRRMPAMPAPRPTQATRKPSAQPAKKFAPPAKKHWSKRRRAVVFSGLSVVMVFVLAGGWLGWKVLRNSSKVFGGSLQSNLASLVDPSVKLKGEDQGRVNILLAGVSTDDPGHDGADLTDSIMIVSLDTNSHKAFMLSVPRDLWVNIPVYGGHSKINAVNHYGAVDNFQAAGYPNGGMGLLEKTVSQDFGMPIDYYVKIDYTAFRDAVNSVGGIDVNLQSNDPRGFYDPNISKADQGPLKLPNGPNHLTGQIALNLARARGDPTYDGRVEYGFQNSDFTRTQNQRLMLVALKNKATSTQILANPLKMGQLLDSVGNNVQTDLKLSEVKRLYQLGQGVGNNGVQSLSLSDQTNNIHLVSNYTAPDGSSALAPTAGVDDFSSIQLFIKKLTSDDAVVRESANVVILNGSEIAGLGTREGTTLTSKGFNVSTVANAPADSSQTFIIDNSAGKKPNSLKALQALFGKGTQTSAKYTAPLTTYSGADFVIVLGQDQTAQQLQATQ